jgi:hypothetical protein
MVPPELIVTTPWGSHAVDVVVHDAHPQLVASDEQVAVTLTYGTEVLRATTVERDVFDAWLLATAMELSAEFTKRDTRAMQLRGW